MSVATQYSTATEVWEMGFKNLLEHMDPMFEDNTKKTPSLWINMIQRGPYTLGQGLVQKKNRFHGHVGDQHDLTKWEPIQTMVNADGEDSGYNPCRYNAYLIEDGTETLEYTGFQTYRRTTDICLNHVKWIWQFQKQLELKASYLVDVTRSIWENWGREQYINQCSKYVLSRGNPEQYSFTYDPFTPDADGDSVIVIDRDIPVSLINPDAMDYFTNKFTLSCPDAAMGTQNGQPMFTCVLSMEDFDDMIVRDAERRDDWRHYNDATYNVQGFMPLRTYRQNLMVHDLVCPRFQVKSSDATTITLKRVAPMVQESTTIGNKWVVNTDYLKAEYALAIYFLKNSYRTLVPPSGPGSVSPDYRFGASPSLNGEFLWINIPDREENLLGEVGFHFARYQAFAEPLKWFNEGVALLYKRAPQITTIYAEPGGDEQQPVGDLIHIASTSAYALVSGTDDQATIVLASYLGCESPAEVTVTDDNGATTTAIISKDSNAPEYTLLWPTATDRPAAADMNDTAVAGVTCA